jgi:hypothetical protein
MSAAGYFAHPSCAARIAGQIIYPGTFFVKGCVTSSVCQSGRKKKRKKKKIPYKKAQHSTV